MQHNNTMNNIPPVRFFYESLADPGKESTKFYRPGYFHPSETSHVLIPQAFKTALRNCLRGIAYFRIWVMGERRRFG